MPGPIVSVSFSTWMDYPAPSITEDSHNNSKSYPGIVEELPQSAASDASVLEEIAKMLAAAMNDDPSTFYYFQEQDSLKRWEMGKELQESILYLGLEHGKIFVAKSNDGYDGACILMPPDQYPINLVSKIQGGLASLLFKVGLGAAMRLVNAPTNTPPPNSWFLFAIGVSPEKQGKGVGSPLLQKALEVCHQRREKCFLQTFKEKNIRFYAKHGFEVVEEIPANDNGFPKRWIMIHSI